MKIFTYSALMVSAVALGACSSGSSSSSGGSGNGLGANQFSAIEAGTAGRALSDGKTLGAVNTAFMSRDFDANTSTLTSGNFSLKKAADGLVFTLNGVEHTLTAANYDAPYGYVIDDAGTNTYVNIYSNNGEITPNFDPSSTSYVQVYSVSSNQTTANPNVQLDGYVVVGTETLPAQMDLLTSASYDGYMNTYFQSATDPHGGTGRVRVRGPMTMTADFSSGDFSGVTKPGQLLLTPSGGSEGSMTGSLSLDSGTISGASMSGNVTVDSDFQTNSGVGSLTGTYDGHFYGPFADQAAGTMSGTTSNDYVMVGQFNGNKQN